MFTKFPGHKLADLRNVTRLFFNGYVPFAILPPLEGVQLALQGQVLHPLNDLPGGKVRSGKLNDLGLNLF